MASNQQRGKSSPRTLILGIAAVVLAVAALGVWLREQQTTQPRPEPTAAAGANEAIHVLNALTAEGLDASFQPSGIPAGRLSVPGQALSVNGVPLYVFVFQSPAEAQAAAATDPAEILQRPSLNASPSGSPSGAPVATEPPYVAHGSNIVVVLVGDDDNLRAKIDAAVARLR